MNICYICHEYPPLLNGGIGTFTKELAEGLVGLGHNVTVIGFYDQVEKVKEANINGVNLVFFKKTNILFSLYDRIKLRKLFKELDERLKFDVVEYPDFLGWGGSIPKGSYVRLARLHGSSTYFSTILGVRDKKSYLWRIVEKYSLNNTDAIASVSKYTADKTQEIFKLGCEIEIIHNAVYISDSPEFSYSDECLNFIFAGSLLKKKGVLELARAWDIFSKKQSNVMLTFVGKDPENNWPLISSAVSSNTIDYIGAIPKEELIALYNKYDCAVFPSHAEAFALAPMEAMGQGIPIIYSTLTSGKELIEHNTHGLLVDPTDVNDIYEKLNFMSSLNSKERMEMAYSAKSRIKNDFNFINFLSKNEAYYEKIANKKNSRKL